MNQDKSELSNGLDSEQNDNAGRLSAMFLVSLSCSLVLIMATALFVSVGFNPKQEGYGKLPWVYAISCLLGSAASWIIYYRLDPDHSSVVKVK